MIYLGRAERLCDLMRLCAEANPEAKLNFDGKDFKVGVDLWYNETANEILFI